MPDRKPNQVRITLGLTKYVLTATLRNKASAVFGLLIPLGFVLVFGLFQGDATKIDVGIDRSLSNSQNALVVALRAMTSKKDSPVQLEQLDRSEINTKLKSGNLGGAIVASGSGTGIEVLTSTANPISSATTLGILHGISDQINLGAAMAAAPPGFEPPAQFSQKSVSGHESRYIDFVLPGMIGFSLIGLATFGVAFPLLTLRKTLVLKRMLATPARPLSFVISQCLSRSVQAVAQAAVILGVGVAVYHFNLVNGAATFIEMMVVAFLGVLSFLGFGILIANIAREEQTAPLLLNLFTVPQFLLGSVFFSTNGLPAYVRVVADNLPLSLVTQGMRRIATDGAHLPQLDHQLVGMLAWSVISYLLAARTFRTE